MSYKGDKQDPANLQYWIQCRRIQLPGIQPILQLSTRLNGFLTEAQHVIISRTSGLKQYCVREPNFGSSSVDCRGKYK